MSRMSRLVGLILSLSLFDRFAAAGDAGIVQAGDAFHIEWFQDWEAARAAAIGRQRTVAVEVWAAWCHTCLSMKHHVLTDAALARVRDRHVWLALDYDRPQNAAFFERFPVESFPTFLVIDPRREIVLARWAGSGTAEQMVRFFLEAGADKNDAQVAIQRALAQKDYRKARRLAENLLKKPIADAGRRTRVLNGYLEALWHLDAKACAEAGLKYLQAVDHSAPGIDFVAYLADCGSKLAEEEKKRVARAVRDRLAPLADDSSLELSADDRSGLYAVLIDAYDTLGEKELAQNALRARLNLLEEAAARAGTPEQRLTFDAHRLECYLRLQAYERAEKMLLESEREQPENPHHPYRLALLYGEQGRWAEALSAIDRALERGYGPRRMRLLLTKIDLLIKSEDVAGARQTIGQAQAELSALPKYLVRQEWKEQLAARLAELKDRRPSPPAAR